MCRAKNIPEQCKVASRGREMSGSERRKEAGREESVTLNARLPLTPFCSFCQSPRASAFFICHSYIAMARITRLLCHRLLMKKATSVFIGSGLTVAGYRNVRSGVRMPGLKSPLSGQLTVWLHCFGSQFHHLYNGINHHTSQGSCENEMC